MGTHTPTPRPWNTQRGEIVGNGDLIAGTVFHGQELSSQDLANAAHIVKCVNGWDEQQAKIDELVKALEVIEIIAAGEQHFRNKCEALAKIERIARKALTRAKAGE